MFKRYFRFAGRATRLEFWAVGVATGLVLFLLLALTAVISKDLIDKNAAMEAQIRALSGPGMVLLIAVVLLVIWPNLAVSVRRLHDRNKSGLWLLASSAPLGLMFFTTIGAEPEKSSATMLVLGLISIAISIWISFELACLRGSVGTNRFDGDPLELKRIEDNFAGSWADRPINDMAAPIALPQVRRAVGPRPVTATSPQGFGRRGLGRG